MLENMADLVQQSPIPIALDEELIQVTSLNEKEKLLECLQPSFIILKPSLHGGIKGCDEWIEIAEAQKIGWWMTSALESNVGLNAIAQYTYSKGIETTHGLGTGGLFSNNIDAPLYIASGQLWYDSAKVFDLSIPWS
jgi:O-succinylbenzoate synthase